MSETKITPAQLDHLRSLVMERDAITNAIGQFTNYLIAEHGLDRDKKWRVMPDGTMVEASPAGAGV